MEPNQQPIDLEAEVKKLNFVIKNLLLSKDQLELDLLVNIHENQMLKEENAKLSDLFTGALDNTDNISEGDE